MLNRIKKYFQIRKLKNQIPLYKHKFYKYNITFTTTSGEKVTTSDGYYSLTEDGLISCKITIIANNKIYRMENIESLSCDLISIKSYYDDDIRSYYYVSDDEMKMNTDEVNSIKYKIYKLKRGTKC